MGTVSAFCPWHFWISGKISLLRRRRNIYIYTHMFNVLDLLFFHVPQLTPAMVGLFAYKAAALVQVYRDNEDLQFIFPESDWLTQVRNFCIKSPVSIFVHWKSPILPEGSRLAGETTTVYFQEWYSSVTKISQIGSWWLGLHVQEPIWS